MRGYAKCPKCHAPMPGKESRTRRASFAGGTTSQPIETIDAGGGVGGWLWVVAGVVLVAAVIAFVATRGGGDSKKPDQAAAPVDNGPGAASAAQPQQPDNEPAQLPSSQNRPDPAYVADALEGELSVARLFAVVEVTDNTLDVRSAFCADPRFTEITAKYIADLKAAGVTQMRCSETHGAQVFERPL